MTVPPTGFQSNLLTGLAVYIAAATATVGATYTTSGAYTSAQTGIVLGNVPQMPDRVITLTAKPFSDSPSLSDSVLSVQVLTRTAGQDKRATDDLDDALFSLLHGMVAVTLSTGVRIIQCLRYSGSPLGQDEHGRWMNSTNYYVTVHRPSTNRT